MDRPVGLLHPPTEKKKKKCSPIGTSARQHLVDTEDVEGVDTDPHVEGILSRGLGDILVGANTSGFEGFG